MSFGIRKHALVRQRREIKHSQRPEREEPDVIISGLGSATLRHIKSRRAKGSEVKVAVTVADEKQLREIFDAFDFDRSGNVSLIEFGNALDYIRESRHFRKLHKELDKLQKTFIEMDTDGDATVDYQEFTIGMTGEANGAMDGFTPSDLRKLLQKFMEFALITKRQRNIDCIDQMTHDASDIDRYDYFNRIFELHGTEGAALMGDESVTGSETTRPGTADSRPGTSGSGTDAVLKERSQQLVDELLEEDEDDEDVQQRVAVERAALAEAAKLRFEVLKLPPIPRSITRAKTVSPAMTLMTKSKELQLRYRASREAFSAVHGGVDWTDSRYRLAAPKHIARRLGKSESTGKILRRTVG